MPIVLDVNVVRGLAEGEIEPHALHQANDDGLTVHLADGTLAELVNQLFQGRFEWQKWKRVRGGLTQLIDRSEPILLGGREGLCRAGVVVLSQNDDARSSEVTTSLDAMAAGWRLLNNARTLGDLVGRGGRSDRRVTLDPRAVNAEITKFKRSWAEMFDRTFRGVLERSPEVQTQIPERGDSAEWLDGVSREIAADIDKNGPASAPATSVRLDAMIRVYTLLALRRLRAREPYNPWKNANDSFDYDLLRYLAYPAAVCSSDRGIQNDLKASGSFQRAWVVRPEELEDAEVRRRLTAPVWPVV